MIKLDMIGADVEWFLKDKNDELLPCINVVGGTKKNPLPLIANVSGYMIQEDNVALEWGIPPAKDKWTFLYHCQRAREEIEQKLRSREIKLLISPAERFKPEQLTHPQALLLGCEEDANAWEQAINDAPDITGENATLRTTGGHVHVSFTIDGHIPVVPLHLPEIESMVMAFDIWLAIAAIRRAKLNLNLEVERRKLYGRAGAFRPKPYGLEYRVLSPSWTESPEDIIQVFEGVERAINFLNNMSNSNDFTPRTYFGSFQEDIERAINNGDMHSALRIAHHFLR